MKTLKNCIVVVSFLSLATVIWGRPGNPDYSCIPGSDVSTEQGECKCTDDGKNFTCPPKHMHHHEKPESNEHEVKPLKSNGDTSADLLRKQKEDTTKEHRKWRQELEKKREETEKEGEVFVIDAAKEREKMSKMDWNEDNFEHIDIKSFPKIEVPAPMELNPENIEIEAKLEEFDEIKIKPIELHPLR